MQCENNLEVKKKKPLVADAGPDQTIPACSYVIIDASNSYFGENPGRNLLFEWTHDPNNPQETTGLWTGDNKIHAVGFIKEGVYRFTLVVSSDEGRSEPDELIITVTPRQKSVLIDPRLEITARYSLKKQYGDLTKEDVLKLDTLTAYGIGNSAPKVTTLEGVQFCENLTFLGLNSQNITDITQLKNLKKLKHLELNQNYHLEDISPLAELTNLEYLDLDTDLRIKDIFPLRNLTKLKYLDIMYDTLITDISAIKNMKDMEELGLVDLNVNSIDAVENLINLKVLWASGMNIIDIKPLANLKKIYFLHMCDNLINDITPIKNLRLLVRLYLRDNKIENISPLEFLPNINQLHLDNNKIKDISPLVRNNGIGKGDLVVLDGNPLSEKSKNEYIPQLQKRGVMVFY